MTDPLLIESPKALDELCVALRGCRAIALDTEFLWTRTYYPRLGLVQLADDQGRIGLVDSVKIPDLSPLGAVLADASVVKVLHDATQDLAILARAAGVQPATVFDTSVAAGFCRLPVGLSLHALVLELLGVELSKGETRSNWIARPLRPQQLKYAADDEVRAWMMEEMASRTASNDSLDRDPREAWRRVKGMASLDARKRAVLRELAAWREVSARESDVPRGFWLTDECLVDIAHALPATVPELLEIRGVPRSWGKKKDGRGKAVLRCIGDAMRLPEEELPRSAPSATISREELKGRVGELRAFIAGKAKPFGIDPAVIASRANLEAAVIADLEQRPLAPPSIRSGWRAELLARRGGPSPLRTKGR
jgi:ribonuclease D